MYIIADIHGKLIQKSNVNITNGELESLISYFQSGYDIPLTATMDESMYHKSNKMETYDIIIENNIIVDIIPLEKPILPTPVEKPTVEERLTQLEVLTVNNISNQIENQILKGGL